MNSSELYHLLELPAEAIVKLEKCKNNFQIEEVEPYLTKMMTQETSTEACQNLKAFFQNDEGNFKMLYCHLECARRIYQIYREWQISDDIYIDTMKCFQRFLYECERKTGELFFDRSWWTYRQISMALFRIGELEYELCKSEKENTIHIHIPSDADFSPENIDESLNLAKNFIRQHYPSYDQVNYVCDSWLLSPALKQLLPEQSNILDFQKRFTILQVNTESKEYIEWLFQVPKDKEYHSLPEHTQLQKNAKKFLMEGGNIGSAYGVMR